jgi:putative transposase
MLHRRLPRIDLPGHSYYLGCCLENRRQLLRQDAFAQLLLNLYLAQRDRGSIKLHGYVIMPDHYHVLLSLREEKSISQIVREVHSLFARTCRKMTEIKGRIWQRRFYDHVIRDKTDWLTKLAYLHNNPLRAGLVENIADYPWSSCRFWETGTGPVRCDGWE